MSDQQGSWEPDPFGRNQYRWFDGSGWTDNVSNDGVVSSDPPDPGGAPPPGGEAAAEPPAEEPPAEPEPAPEAAPEPEPAPAEPLPTEPVAATPPPATPSGWGAPGSEPTMAMPPTGAPPPGPTPTQAAAAGGGGGGGNKVPLIIGGVALVALLGAAAFFFLGGDDDDGLSDAERASIVAEITEDGELSGDQADCLVDELVDRLGVDRVREIAATGGDMEPDDEMISAAFAAATACDIDLLGGASGDTTDTTEATTETTEAASDTTDTTEGGTDTTEAAGGDVPDALVDGFVQGFLQSAPGIAEEDARCFAERFLAGFEGDLAGLADDPEAAFSDPAAIADLFDVFAECGIDIADLAGAGGFPGLGEVPGTGGDQPSTYGDDPQLDALWDACEAGDGQACDDLYFQSPIGSEYERFGDTCGGRFEAGTVLCANEL